MKTGSGWWKTIAGLAVLAVVAVGLGLLFRGRQQTSPVAGVTATFTLQPMATQEITATPTTAIVPTTTVLTSPAPVTVVAPTETAQPEATTPISGLDDYVFSEPQVVLTNTRLYIAIAGWLPDSEQILIMRGDPERPQTEFIETFNTRTKDVQRFGKRHWVPGKPCWLPTLQGVAYTDWAGKEYRALYTGRGEATPKQTVATGLSSPYIGADPSGRRLLFFTEQTGERPQVWDVQQKTIQSLPFVLAPLSDTLGLVMPSPYLIAWHPKENKVAFYNNYHFFIADLDTGQVAEIELGTDNYGLELWAMEAQWSPDGRYIAMLTASGDLPVEFSELTILDTVRGKLRSMHPEQYIYPGQYYVTDVAWGPDSYHLVVSAVTRQDEIGVEYNGLYLTDTGNAKFLRLLPEHEFGGSWGAGLAWSPDGLRLAVSCPTLEEGRLCLISVSQEAIKESLP